jgi:cytochrome oxidase assembly protein ShyY1
LVNVTTTIDGWLRKGDKVIYTIQIKINFKGNAFLPKNEIENNQWYWIDIDTMSKLANTEPILIEMTTSQKDMKKYLNLKQPLPRPSNTDIRIRNTHLEYAVTWYVYS